MYKLFIFTKSDSLGKKFNNVIPTPNVPSPRIGIFWPLFNKIFGTFGDILANCSLGYLICERLNDYYYFSMFSGPVCHYTVIRCFLSKRLNVSIFVFVLSEWNTLLLLFIAGSIKY